MTERAIKLRRAFSLIEAAAVIVIVALIVPPVATMLTNSAGTRAEHVSLARASMLGDAVLETIVADAASDEPTLGFGAFADADAYLNASGTGLRDRLSATAELYAQYGLGYVVTIGPLADASGQVTGDAGEDRYRLVTVIVTHPSQAGSGEVSFAVVLGDLG